MLATKINNNQWLYFVFALMKCSKAAFGEQKQGMNLQQHKQHDSTIIPLGNNTPQRQGLFFKTIIVNRMSIHLFVLLGVRKPLCRLRGVKG